MRIGLFVVPSDDVGMRYFIPASFLLTFCLLASCEHNAAPGAVAWVAATPSSVQLLSAADDHIVNKPLVLPELVLPAPIYAEPTWHVADSGQDFLGPYSVKFSQGGALVSAGGDHVGVVHRAVDGRALGIPAKYSPAVMDSDWNISATVIHPDRLQVNDVRTDALLTEFVLPEAPREETPWLRATYPAVAPDGEHVGVLMCWDQVGPGSTTSTLVVWDVASEQPIFSQDIGIGCRDGSLGSRQYIQFTSQGDRVIIVQPGTYTLVTVDILTGQVATLDLEEVSFGEVIEHPYYSDPVLALAVAPNGEQLAVSTRHGEAHRIDIASLEVLETVDVGAFHVHQHSYMPSIQSPLAWSPDSTRLAVVNDDGEPALLNVTDMSAPIVLRRPRLTGDDYGLSLPGSPGYLLALAFSPDGAGVVALGEAGLSGWFDLSAPSQQASGAVSLVISTFNSAVKGDDLTINVQATGFADLAVRTLLVDGRLVPGQSAFSGDLTFRSYQSGVFQIQVQVDDGVRTAITEPLQVSIQEPAKGH